MSQKPKLENEMFWLLKEAGMSYKAISEKLYIADYVLRKKKERFATIKDLPPKVVKSNSLLGFKDQGKCL